MPAIASPRRDQLRLHLPIVVHEERVAQLLRRLVHVEARGRGRRDTDRSPVTGGTRGRLSLSSLSCSMRRYWRRCSSIDASTNAWQRRCSRGACRLAERRWPPPSAGSAARAPRSAACRFALVARPSSACHRAHAGLVVHLDVEGRARRVRTTGSRLVAADRRSASAAASHPRVATSLGLQPRQQETEMSRAGSSRPGT